MEPFPRNPNVNTEDFEEWTTSGQFTRFGRSALPVVYMTALVALTECAASNASAI